MLICRAGRGTSYSVAMNTVDLGRHLAASLQSEETVGDRLRLVRQFIMDCDNSSNVTAQISDASMLTGDRGWDALVAGVVEDIAYRHGSKVPRWTMEPERFTDDRWWFVTAFPALHATAFVETPASLANRGVFIRRASLVNI